MFLYPVLKRNKNRINSVQWHTYLFITPAHDYGTAYYKAQLAVDNNLPTKGTVFLSIRDDDRDRIVDIARKLRSTGLYLLGTGGAVAYLRNHGVAAIPIKKVSEGSPNVVDLIRAGKVDLIINTPGAG